MKMTKYVFAIPAICLIIFHTSDSIYTENKRSLKRSQSHNHSHTYFDEFAHIRKIVQLKQDFHSSDIQKALDNIFESFVSFSKTPSKQVQNIRLSQKKLLTKSVDSNGVTRLGIENLLVSTLGRLAATNTISSACVNDTSALTTGLINQESWAIQFIDSSGKPGPGLTQYRVNFVGDYAQCRSASAVNASGGRSFSGNYCILKAHLGPPGGASQLGVQLGACIPDSCSVSDNTLLLSEAIQQLGLNGTLQADPGECHTDDREATTATVIAIIFLAVIGLLMILGTAYDIIVIQWPQWRVIHEKDTAKANGYTSIGGENLESRRETEPLLSTDSMIKGGNKPTGMFAQLVLAFSVYTNGSKVLDARQPPGSLSAIHGIRFLSMSWVILGHLFGFGMGQFENLATVMPVLLRRWTFDAIANALVSVDTFFTLSGLLTAFVALNEMKKTGWKINWPLYYFHRFWRLTPPYMLTVLTVMGLMQYLGSGALWNPVQPADRVNCEKNWWTNLLYVNNLVRPDNMCCGHTWYLANDMQFFIISPLMIVPFYFNGFIGVAVCVCFLLATWITTGVLSTVNQWPSTLISAQITVENLNMSLWFEDYYLKPWCRIGSYVVGVLAGYCLSANNGRVRMRWYVVCLGWIIATATALAAVYGLHGEITGKNVSSVGVAAFYNAVARSAWGACVSWVIIACASGYGGFVNSILSWSPFVVLGRLTYVSYLIHPYVLYIYFQNQERLYYVNDTNMVVSFCGIIVLTNMFAFVLMLAFESPWIGLEKVFLHKKRSN
ncbi:hypothetical protein BsWGS_23662 [Bradybaena similaris]